MDGALRGGEQIAGPFDTGAERRPGADGHLDVGRDAGNRWAPGSAGQPARVPVPAQCCVQRAVAGREFVVVRTRPEQVARTLGRLPDSRLPQVLGRAEQGAQRRCRPVGVLNMTDEAGGDAKLIAVPHDKLSQLYVDVKEYTDLPPLLIEQIKHFFEN